MSFFTGGGGLFMPAGCMVQTLIFSKRKNRKDKIKNAKIRRKKMVKSKNLERRKSKHSKSKSAKKFLKKEKAKNI